MVTKALLLGAFAAFAAAQSQVLTFTRVPNPVTDGQPQAITYATNDTDTAVEIILRKGPSSNLQTVEVLTSSADGGQFVWTPRKSLPNGADYALEIRQGDQVNYFGPLTVQGAIAASVSAYASASSANATTTSTSTSTGTGGSAASMGTGTTMHRNTTMSLPHKTTHRTTTTPKSTMTTTSGASFQGSPTGGQNNPTPTGGASMEYSASSSFALVFGALAAILYLH